MPTIDAYALLAAWERAVPQNSTRRALTLLGATNPERSVEEWSLAPIGQRDAALLRVREELLGERLSAAAECPNCGERLEMTISTRDIEAPELEASEAARVVECDGFRVTFRPPNSADLIAVGAVGRDALLARCVSGVEKDGRVAELSELTDRVVARVAAAMGEADPGADIRLALQCPECGHGWSVVFDIVSYFWRELEDWAQRAMLDVHVLASAYGWSEREILGMSARRRQFYLELAGA
jgi:hypothetical protein